MENGGPIIIVEDDEDDREILEDIFKELNLGNRRVYFDNAPDAFVYLKSTDELLFLIVSDINMPKMSGLQFKKMIDADQELRQKSIPFVFLSTSADKVAVTEAYTAMTVQGFFRKKSTMQEMKEMLSQIVFYWKECRHPNTSE